MKTRDIQVQHLLGRRAHDRNGRVVGRVEELVVENRDGELVVVEYRLGPAAAFERFAIAAGQLPLLKHIPLGSRREYRVRWDQMDLSDVDHPRITVARDELERQTIA